MQNFLPKIYCFINEFNLTELSKLSSNINLIYRNYDKQDDIKTILKLRDFCIKNGNKLFISNRLKLALNLKLNGVYIPSFNNITLFIINLKNLILLDRLIILKKY